MSAIPIRRVHHLRRVTAVRWRAHARGQRPAVAKEAWAAPAQQVTSGRIARAHSTHLHLTLHGRLAPRAAGVTSYLTCARCSVATHKHLPNALPITQSLRCCRTHKRAMTQRSALLYFYVHGLHVLRWRRHSSLQPAAAAAAAALIVYSDQQRKRRGGQQ